jgi:flagellar biosynthesis protein
MDNKKAVALEYNAEKSNAPRITAKGAGIIAEKIIEKAKENDVPIYYDKALVETLNSMQLGEEIPSELYEVVAEILVYIANLDMRNERENRN